MGKLFIGSLDLNKIDKSKVVTTDKNGKPFENGAKYYNVVVWLNDEVDQYGNIGSIQDSSTKEDREAGVKAAYLGNFKNIATQNASTSKPQQGTGVKADDPLPF